ncbi:hypothetical protein SK128_026773 [Halocaridina rubra]|uniref:Uncharacterized protein n=1 Tax=Halocaridina rubra TaxID=373956 RepID=A0AAN8XAJ6_HALRR
MWLPAWRQLCAGNTADALSRAAPIWREARRVFRVRELQIVKINRSVYEYRAVARANLISQVVGSRPVTA